MNVRQSVVVRRDLQMSPGLLAAQVAHLSTEFILRHTNDLGQIKEWNDVKTQWMHSPVLSVLAVNTPEELDVLTKLADEVGVKYMEWEDTIPSQIFAGRFLEVVVGVAFGPDDDEKIKQVTGTLPLY